MPVTSLMKSEDFLGKEALSVEHSSGGGGRSATGKRPPHMTMKVGMVDIFCLVFLADNIKSLGIFLAALVMKVFGLYVWKPSCCILISLP